MPEPNPAHTALVDALLVVRSALDAIDARSAPALAGRVTSAQLRVLAVLAELRSPTAGDLAGHVGVTPPTASRMVQRLAVKGLVRRTRCGGDRRRVGIALSGTGRELVDGATKRRSESLAAILSRLEPDQRAELGRSLTAFAAAADAVLDPEPEGTSCPEPKANHHHDGQAGS